MITLTLDTARRLYDGPRFGHKVESTPNARCARLLRDYAGPPRRPSILWRRTLAPAVTPFSLYCNP